MAARKKGDLVQYCGGLFPTDARKPPSGPLVKPKMDLYCRGFYVQAIGQLSLDPSEVGEGRVADLSALALFGKSSRSKNLSF